MVKIELTDLEVQLLIDALNDRHRTGSYDLCLKLIGYIRALNSQARHRKAQDI